MTAADENVLTNEAAESSPISIIRSLQEGTLPTEALSAESRRTCIEHLHIEGYSAGEIAEIFKVSVRTVRRDVAQIREDHCVVAEPKFVARIVGQLVQEAESSIARLRRIARDRECPHAAKVEAERSAWTVMRELIEKLQSLGYLPTAAQQIEAELTHRIESHKLSEEFLEVERVLKDVAIPEGSEAAKQLTALREQRATASASLLPPHPVSPRKSPSSPTSESPNG